MSIECCGKMLCYLRIYVLKVVLLPTTEVLGQNNKLQKYSLQNKDEWKVDSEFVLLAQKWSKIAPRVFANHHAAHSEGVSRSRGLWLWLLALVKCDR